MEIKNIVDFIEKQNKLLILYQQLATELSVPENARNQDLIDTLRYEINIIKSGWRMLGMWAVDES